jgi:hypothetical protein
MVEVLQLPGYASITSLLLLRTLIPPMARSARGKGSEVLSFHYHQWGHAHSNGFSEASSSRRTIQLTLPAPFNLISTEDHCFLKLMLRQLFLIATLRFKDFPFIIFDLYQMAAALSFNQ